MLKSETSKASRCKCGEVYSIPQLTIGSEERLSQLAEEFSSREFLNLKNVSADERIVRESRRIGHERWYDSLHGESYHLTSTFHRQNI